ncbi:unnamed protein product [Rotaria magnacalcarata]|uniref:Mesencephalic astrocyte-derived neurotrophic factor homolog n=2 Tax=Rotaria TaxID=231623 RepID=A0A8S2NKC6_9BILA|nr:unnamed protein product [Rotaria magnacalcarata]
MQSLSYFTLLIVITLFAFSIVQSKKAVDETHCEVCIKTIGTFFESLTDDEKTNPEKIEKGFKKFCSKIKVDSKEHRLCYYIGALETSATYAIGDLSKPLSWGIPIEKVCRERLSKTNPQICDLKYEKQIDVNAVDLNKLKVKDLKKILSDWGESVDFIEKSEFIKRINESDGVFKFQIERDYDNRFYKKQLTKKDFRLETEKLSQMFNEHPALFKLTPKRDKIRRAPQFPEPAPDRSGI